ncbi:MAG: bifunctional adenosylcobinamide kinase/adenosylcobinamide-phosphate guanylyltransferase [Thermodesulfobacteriota bacterium]|nr:bifunctional adenosylcobinamide kinase/adenosylcobinamide-phosphate guanylyltransferase [Thermodesulfobacteriota bacterium]
MKNKTTLIIGGCRSGKSSHALEIANHITGSKKIFIATSVPTDHEMEKRVTKHKTERGESWQTAEVPVKISEKIEKLSKQADVILVDCLTLWVSNLLFNNFKEDEIFQRVEVLRKSLENSACPVILVSNEVGAGIVPENKLARQFRDIAGFVNQKIAATVDSVIWTVAGIPVTIKGKGHGNFHAPAVPVIF